MLSVADIVIGILQDKATSGKQGLGIGDCPRKIGGAHFKGQKTTFQDEDEGGNLEGPTGNDDLNCASVSKDHCVEQTTEKRKRDDEVGSEGAEIRQKKTRRKGQSEATDGGNEKPGVKLKWKKACKAILQEVQHYHLRSSELYHRPTLAL